MTTSTSAFGINGIISTNKTVWQNLDSLAIACNSFITFDINQGKWAVIINRAGSSISSFNDGNIIGGITVSGTSLDGFYNQAQVSFPHKDILGRTDTIIATLDQDQWYANESQNILNIQCDLINDPAQAELIASTQLKQSRVDTIVNFQTDYSKLGLKAGDLIDITNSQYGFTNKVFRITSIEEVDTNEGIINLNITALAYDAGVYDYSGLTRELRSPVTGITIKAANPAIEQSNTNSLGKQLGLLGLMSLLNALFPNASSLASLKKLLDSSANPDVTVTVNPEEVCQGNTITVSIEQCCPTCTSLEGIVLPYSISGVTSSDVSVSLSGNITLAKDGKGSLSIPTLVTGSTSSKTMTIKVGSITKTATIKPLKSWIGSANPSTITEGESSTVTFTTVGVADGTSLPYTITTEDATISGPTSGNVTITGNSGSITVATSDSGSNTSGSISVVLDPEVTYCSSTPATITVEQTGPVIPPDSQCQMQSIPYAWCPTYDGATGQVKGLTPSAYVSVSKPISGRSTVSVPLTVTVTPGNPSTVAIATSVTVDAGSGGVPGVSVDVITSFNSIPANGIATGTTTTLKGLV